MTGFMSVRRFDTLVGRNDSPTYTRLTNEERAALDFTERDFHNRHAMSMLSSSGALATEWLRRQPITTIVTIRITEFTTEKT
jgi:hypothetical protein